MHIEFIVEPIIYMQSNKLRATEVLSRFISDNGGKLSAEYMLNILTPKMKSDILEGQIKKIISKRDFFIDKGVICSVNLDYELCMFIHSNKAMQEAIRRHDFIALEISENYPNLNEDDSIIRFLKGISKHIWLDDFGSGNATLSTVSKKLFDAVKIDKGFLQKNIGTERFQSIISEIKKHCQLVIAEGIENEKYFKNALSIDFWGGQGYFYPGLNIDKIENLNEDFAK